MPVQLHLYLAPTLTLHLLQSIRLSSSRTLVGSVNGPVDVFKMGCRQRRTHIAGASVPISGMNSRVFNVEAASMNPIGVLDWRDKDLVTQGSLDDLDETFCTGACHRDAVNPIVSLALTVSSAPSWMRL